MDDSVPEKWKIIFSFRLRQFGAGCQEKCGQKFAIVDVFNEQVILCTGIGRGKGTIRRKRTSGFYRLDKELVVVDRAEELAVQVQPIFAEHLFVNDLSGGRKLVGNKNN